MLISVFVLSTELKLRVQTGRCAMNSGGLSGAAAPHEQFGVPPASVLGAGLSRPGALGWRGFSTSEGRGAAFCGQTARWTGQEGPPPHCEKLPSCNALSFCAGGSGRGPRALLSPLGSRCDRRLWCCPPPALPAGPCFPLGRRPQSPAPLPGHQETTH